MKRRAFLKLLAASPIAAVLPAAASKYNWTTYGLSIPITGAPSLTESALEQAVIDLSNRSAAIAVRPTRLICPAAFREIVEPILKKHFDEVYATLPDVN